MLDRVEFINFRGFRHIDLPQLSQISLLTGKNSAGKSSVLEGIFLLMGYALPDTFDKIRNLRGLSAVSEISKLWEPLFHNMDMQQPLRINANYGGENLCLEYRKDESFYNVDLTQSIQNTYITFSNPTNTAHALQYVFTAGDNRVSGHLFLNTNQTLAMSTDADSSERLKSVVPNTLFVRSAFASAIDDTALAAWFGELELAGGRQLVIDALKIVDPSITDVKTIVQQRSAQLFVCTSDSMLPVKLSGDGMCKLIYLVLAILQSKNSLILIDEIENGLHYSMQGAFWRFIAETAKKCNSQIIATTHSYECVTHAVEGASQAGMLDDFSLHRLERVGDENRVAHYYGNLLRSAVDSYMEVR